MQSPPYSLAELVDEFGVPERTIRSWIHKGLLPRPEGRGPATVYGQEHADRLGFVVRLREAVAEAGGSASLPLEMIRGILDSLEPEMIHRVATGEEPLAVADLMPVWGAAAGPPRGRPSPAPPRPTPARAPTGPSTTIQLEDGLELRLNSDDPERVAWLARLARRVRELMREDDL